MTEQAANPMIYRIEATRLIERMRSELATSEFARDTFRSDPGGYLDYVGAMDRSPLPQQGRDRVAADVIETLFHENGWDLP